MRRKPGLIFIICCWAFFGTAAGVFFPAAAAGELLLPLGTETVPGAWVEARVTAAARQGVLTPRLAVTASGGGEPGFVCALPPQTFPAPRELSFWLLAPRRVSRLRFSLSDEQGREVYAQEAGMLTPSLDNLLPRAAMAAPPAAAEFYAPLSSVFIPSAPETAAARWSLAAQNALLTWVLTGGEAICADHALYTCLRTAAGSNAGREQALIITPDTPRALFFNCGRGVIASLRGNTEALPRLRGKLRVYTPERARQKDDWRLAEKRYQRLGLWPEPGRLSPKALWLWGGGWLILGLCGAWLIPSRYRAAGLGLFTVFYAVLFTVAVPAPGPREVSFRFADATAREFTLAEEIRILTPARSGAPLTLDFTAMPPPRLLAANAAELAAAQVTLTLNDSGNPPGGRLHIAPPTVVRGNPLIFSRRAVLPPRTSPEKETIPTLHLPPLAGTSLPPKKSADDDGSPAAARERIAYWLAGENPPPPAAAAVFTWTPPPAAGKDCSNSAAFGYLGELTLNFKIMRNEE